LSNFLLIFFVVAGVIVFSCTPDAPRSNPLDPYHQESAVSGVQMNGFVVRKTAPFLPLPLCDVFILPENKFTATNEQGRFVFSGLQAGDHQLLIHKTGYDSSRIVIPADSLLGADLFVYMNAKPSINNLSIHSEYIDQWWPNPFLAVVVEATAQDPDGVGDLQIPWLNIAGYDTTLYLSATSQPDSFVLILEEEGFSGNDLFDIVGKPMVLTVQDGNASRVVKNDEKLIRIISPSPVADSPTGLAVADSSPLFNWQPFIVSYRFRYVVSIYFIRAGVPVLMFQSGPLLTQQRSFQFVDTLATGTYFWTVSVLDEFGNIGRSKEASFIVP
jgi:hypothetical protein